MFHVLLSFSAISSDKAIHSTFYTKINGQWTDFIHNNRVSFVHSVCRSPVYFVVVVVDVFRYLLLLLLCCPFALLHLLVRMPFVPLRNDI